LEEGEGVQGVVSALRAQTRNRGRVNVYLDGHYAFALTHDLAAELQVGQELSATEVEALRRRDAEAKVYRSAVRMIGRRPRSERELRRAWDRRGVSPEIQDRILERLRKAGLVDDAAFARAWVENRSQFRPRSARALRYELRTKGVAPEFVDQALEGFDEQAAAYAVARRAARRAEDSSYHSFRRRVGGALKRRGFDYSTIRLVVQRVWTETTGNGEESEVSK
jgi:regulatory protein